MEDENGITIVNNDAERRAARENWERIVRECDERALQKADELAKRDAEVLALQDENVVLRARLDALAARLEKIDGQKEVLEDGTK